MKKFLTALLLSALLLASCGTPAAEDRSLYEHGLDVVALIDEMVNNEDYVRVYSGSDDILNVTRTIAEGDYSSPKNVYKVTIPDTIINALSEADSLSDASPELLDYLRQKTLASIPIQITSTEGVNFLAAASICTAGKTFLSDEVPEYMIYLYTYENAVPIAVTFGRDANVPGVVSATGTFLSHSDRSFETKEDVELLFSEYAAAVEVVPAG